MKHWKHLPSAKKKELNFPGSVCSFHFHTDADGKVGVVSGVDPTDGKIYWFITSQGPLDEKPIHHRNRIYTQRKHVFKVARLLVKCLRWERIERDKKAKEEAKSLPMNALILGAALLLYGAVSRFAGSSRP